MFLGFLFSSVSTRASCPSYDGEIVWPRRTQQISLGDRLYLAWDAGSKADFTNSTTVIWNIWFQDSLVRDANRFKIDDCSRSFTFNTNASGEWWWDADDPYCNETTISCWYRGIPADISAGTYVAVGIRDAAGSIPATTVSSGPFTILGSTTTSTPSKNSAEASKTSSPAVESSPTAPAADGVSAGAIAGSVLGGILILLCLSGLVWILLRKRHAKKTFESAAAARAEDIACWKPELDGGAIPPLVRSGVELDTKEVDQGELDGKTELHMEQTGVELDSKTVGLGELDGEQRWRKAGAAAASDKKNLRIDVTSMAELDEGRPTRGRNMETASLAPSLD